MRKSEMVAASRDELQGKPSSREPEPGRLKRRALVTLAAIIAMGLANPSAAHADTVGCADGNIKGLTTQFAVCLLINGDGTRVDRFRVGTDVDTDFGIGLGIGKKGVSPGIDISSDHDVPTIDGCEMHANVYNSDRSVNYNSPAMPCPEVNKRRQFYKLNKWDSTAYSGVVFEIPVGEELPKGRYCGTLWVKMNGSYHSAGAACKKVTP